MNMSSNALQVNMARRDYRRHFARDASGKYVGLEKERAWSVEDLSHAFGCYRDVVVKASA